MDVIFIEQLSVFMTIGAYDWERHIQQKLSLDIEIGWDTKDAAKSDSIEHCLDYAQVSQTVIKFLETQKFSLIERVAQEVVDIILNQFGAPWVRVKVYKLDAVAQAKQVGVTVERTKTT